MVLHEVAQPAVWTLLLVLEAQVDVEVAHPAQRAASAAAAAAVPPPVGARRSCGPSGAARWAVTPSACPGAGKGVGTPQALESWERRVRAACWKFLAGCERCVKWEAASRCSKEG